MTVESGIREISIKKLLLISAGLLIIDIGIATVLVYMNNAPIEQLDGTYLEPQSSALLKTMIIALVLSIPILSLLLGAITTIFIEKEKPYGKRYSKGYLLTLCGVYILYGLFGLVRIIQLI